VRIVGWLMLIVGILFVVLFGLAAMGGGHLGFTPWLVSVFLILSGWRMRNLGKGILPSQPGAANSAAAGVAGAVAQGQVATSAQTAGTIEIPLTPEIAACIARQSSRNLRNVRYVAFAFAVLGIGAGIVTYIINRGSDQRWIFLGMFSGIGILSAAMIYGISWLTTQRPVRRDLRGNSYLRTTGPLEIVYVSGGAMLRLADKSFMMNGREGSRELSKLNWGRVDYSPHGHVILGAWSQDGQMVYCLAGYTPAG